MTATIRWLGRWDARTVVRGGVPYATANIGAVRTAVKQILVVVETAGRKRRGLGGGCRVTTSGGASRAGSRVLVAAHRRFPAPSGCFAPATEKPELDPAFCYPARPVLPDGSLDTAGSGAL